MGVQMEFSLAIDPHPDTFTWSLLTSEVHNSAVGLLLDVNALP